MDERYALGLGCDEQVILQPGELLRQGFGGRLDQLGVAQNVEHGDL